MHVHENTIKSGRKANQIQILVIQGVEKIETTILFNELLQNKLITNAGSLLYIR